MTNIIEPHGNVEKHSLIDILNSYDSTDGELNLMNHTKYMDEDSLASLKIIHNNFLNILSLNCQSLLAKLDELKIFLNILKEKGIISHVICLQETWIDERFDTSLAQKNGYNFVSQNRSCSSHGGVAFCY